MELSRYLITEGRTAPIPRMASGFKTHYEIMTSVRETQDFLLGVLPFRKKRGCNVRTYWLLAYAEGSDAFQSSNLPYMYMSQIGFGRVVSCVHILVPQRFQTLSET